MTPEERIADMVQGLESAIQIVQGFSQSMQALADTAREAADKLEVFLAFVKEDEDEEPLSWEDDHDERPRGYIEDDEDYAYYGVDRWGN